MKMNDADRVALSSLSVPSKAERAAALAARGFTKLENVEHEGVKKKLTLAYKLHGDTVAPYKIVFINGLATAGHFLDDLVALFLSTPIGERCQVLTMDNRGAGESSIPSGRYTTSSMAHDWKAVVAHLKWERSVQPLSRRCLVQPRSLMGVPRWYPISSICPLEYRVACQRIQAAVDAREEGGHDILIMARTDALASHGLDEALRRMKAFSALGADILFMEAPRNEAEMRAFCEAVPDKPKMANLVEKGATPCLPTALLDEIGYKLCARPLTLLMAAMNAMKAALEDIKEGKSDTKTDKASFEELKEVIGFPKYYAEEKRYAASSPSLSLPSSFTGGAAVEGTNVGGNTPE